MSSYIPVIGIVGGIGSGKSTVAGCFGELGCAIIDADRIGHELLGQPDIRSRIIRQWGRGILDGQGRIDRKRLGRIVFAEPSELAKLNEIMHPRISERIADEIARIRSAGDARGIILDAAVLIESSWDLFCDELLFVDSPQELRMERVMETRGWDEATWRRREKSQFSVDTKAGACSYRINNSTDVSHLKKRVRSLLEAITT